MLCLTLWITNLIFNQFGPQSKPVWNSQCMDDHQGRHSNTTISKSKGKAIPQERKIYFLGWRRTWPTFFCCVKCYKVMATDFQQISTNQLTFLKLRPKYFRTTRSIPSLLIFWLQLLDSNINHNLTLAYHHSDVIMSAMVFQITGDSIVYSTICSGAYQRKHQSSTLLAFVRGIHQWQVSSPHKGPVMGKMFPFHNSMMSSWFRIVSLPHLFLQDIANILHRYHTLTLCHLYKENLSLAWLAVIFAECHQAMGYVCSDKTRYVILKTNLLLTLNMYPLHHITAVSRIWQRQKWTYIKIWIQNMCPITHHEG